MWGGGLWGAGYLGEGFGEPGYLGEGFGEQGGKATGGKGVWAWLELLPMEWGAVLQDSRVVT